MPYPTSPERPLTTAASSPTVWSTVNSLVLSVGKIHPKNLPPVCVSGVCAGVGEKSSRDLGQQCARPQASKRRIVRS